MRTGEAVVVCSRWVFTGDVMILLSLASVVASLLFIYLLAALLRPEWF
jgi:K+-transporting ATPase KdpF subunit